MDQAIILTENKCGTCPPYFFNVILNGAQRSEESFVGAKCEIRSFAQNDNYLT
jgi:hypothetical protein